MTDWTDFVKAYAKKNDITFKVALTRAGPDFKKQKAKGDKKAPVKKAPVKKAPVKKVKKDEMKEE